MNIPTAEEFLKQRDCIRNVEDFYNDVQPIDLVEFAKLHVQAALKAASENVVVDYTHVEPDNIEVYAINSSILNAYSLKNIV